ncbi:MAG: PD-(D/E)XK nuclease family protein [Planctomycetaceae bacterium]
MKSGKPLIADVIDKLNASPLFQLSLASKELFHSNLLAWLCTAYSDLVMPLFARFLPQQPDVLGHPTVHREHKNVDLMIRFSDGHQLVIENKVKSVPRERQLREYSDAVKNKEQTGFLLLSLTRPGFLGEGDTAHTLSNGVLWHYMSYRDLANLLRPLASSIDERDRYHGDLLKDYIDFISLMDELQTQFAIDWEDPDWNFFGMQDDLRRIKEIRLHDLVDKQRFTELAWRVKARLESEGFSDVVMQHLPDGDPGQISVFSGMTHGVGLFDMKYLLTNCVGEPVLLGVQIQGRQFRLNVQMKRGQTQSKAIAESLLNPRQSNRIWFNLDLVPGDADEAPAKRNFNQYSGIFWYRYKKLGRISPASLIETIVQYARLVRDNQETLRQQIGTQTT